MKPERLQKVMAARGVASRRKCEELILASRVKVDGVVVNELGAKVDPSAEIWVDGQPVLEAQEPIVVMLNKPPGFTATVSDPHAEKTIMDLVRIEGRRLYPIGRLDRESRGLLLLTDDGPLADKVLHPAYKMDKVYEVKARGTFTPKDFARLASGVELEEGGKTAPATIEDINIAPNRASFRIILREGKKRQIRRMVRVVGGHVTEIRRTEFAGLKLGDLPEGNWRRLKPGELKSLRARVSRRPREK